jgi:cellulose synthase/poly-beta-1,6-N-acetylglucosamine synthase-like glycosyltransferase
MALFLFWFSVFMVFYVYIGYPIVVMLLSLVLNRKVRKRAIEPSVTILIAAYNEAENIKQTVQNKLDLDYPEDKLEIIVISDESTDGTDDLVNAFGSTRVRLLRQEPRAGKTAALNMALSYANGDILVFSDANSIYDPIALKKLVANFSDGNVGYVTGKMVYVNQEGSVIGDGCSAYMKYENMLRIFETKIGSIVGVDGGIDAVRKRLYQHMNADQLPDFVLPLKVVEEGYRVIYEPGAVLKEASLKSASDEYRMRVRVSLRAMWALFDMRRLLSVRRFNLFALQLWSHKVLRYLCFIFLVAAYGANWLVLDRGGLYVWLLALQTIAYAGAVAFPLSPPNRWFTPVLRILHYFMLINLACAHSFIKFLMGKKQAVWAPRKG